MNMKRLLLVLMVAALSLPVFSGLADEKPQEYIPSQVIVSMGDSFSSGEGIPPFYGQMDENGKEKTLREKLADQDWLAHRSMNSWGGQLELPDVDGQMRDEQNRNRNWFFAASSGATTKTAREGQNKDIDLYDTNVLNNAIVLLEELVGNEDSLKYENIDVGSVVPLLLTHYSASKKEADKGNFIRAIRNEDVSWMIDPQTDILEKLKNEGRHIDYITITMGGNDLGFSDIVAEVVTNGLVDILNRIKGLPTDDGKKLRDMLETAKGSLTDDGWGETYMSLYYLYREILDNYSDRDSQTPTQLIVAGYPRLFSDHIQESLVIHSISRFFTSVLAPNPLLRQILNMDVMNELFDQDTDKMLAYLGGTFTISDEEVKQVNERVDYFNGVIQGIVEKLNEDGYPNIHFVDVADKFAGHEAFTEKPFLNPVILISRSQDLKLDKASAYSIHPNAAGAAVYKECVQEKIDQLEALKRFRYAMNRTTQKGGWYEGVTDQVSYLYGSKEQAASVDVYDVTVSGYDPKAPGKYTASGEGYRYDAGADEELMYDVTWEDGRAEYSYFYYDLLQNCYVRDDEFSASKKGAEPVNGPWPGLLRPDFPEQVFLEAEKVEELEKYSFTLLLSEKQYKALGLDVASIISKWAADNGVRKNTSPNDPLFNFSNSVTADDYLNEYIRSMSDADALTNFILYGNGAIPASTEFTAGKTESVRMQVTFHNDMTFDTIRLITTGTVTARTEAYGSSDMNIRRELIYKLSDSPTASMQTYFDELNAGASSYSDEDVLDEILNAFGDLIW